MSVKEVYRMAVFAKIIEKGSLSGAAEELAISRSAISQHMTKLEQKLGVKLLNRNSRSIILTDEGRAYHQRCARIVHEAERAEDIIKSKKEDEGGMVRLTSPYNLGFIFVVPALTEFRQTYPMIDIDLILEDRILNMIDERIDVALRVGWLQDSSLYAIKLAPMESIVCCGAEYAKNHALPKKPEQLVDHDWIAISSISHPERLTLYNKKQERETFKINTKIQSNSGYAVRNMIQNGLGIGVLPDYSCKDLIKQGKFIQLIPEWSSRPGSISALFPNKYYMTNRSRILIDFLKDRLLDPPGNHDKTSEKG